ncbi:MAG: hypothetical protein OEV64_07695 [Desulfobulbaceae bacterium]|nr:hypothetical protein [Desulfobulbaceae bacterium]
MKKISTYLCIIFSAISFMLVQNASAEDDNIFAGLNPSLEGGDFDAAVETIVFNSLNQGMGATEILTMAMDQQLGGLGLNTQDVIVSALVALLKSPNLTPDEIELASKNLQIPDDYLQMAKDEIGSDEDVAYTPPGAPAPTGPGFNGAHPAPEANASPSRP